VDMVDTVGRVEGEGQEVFRGSADRVSWPQLAWRN